MAEDMRAAELKQRLAVLGIPPEVSGALTFVKLRGIFITLADFFAPAMSLADFYSPVFEDDRPLG